MSSANEVELAAHKSSSKDGKGDSQTIPTEVKIEPSKENVKPVSVKTLFFKYATKKEIAFLLLGFFCIFMRLLLLFIVAILSGVLTPLSLIFYGELLDELNVQDSDYGRSRILLGTIVLFLFFAAVFAFCERSCLGYFAGKLLAFIAMFHRKRYSSLS